MICTARDTEVVDCGCDGTVSEVDSCCGWIVTIEVLVVDEKMPAFITLCICALALSIAAAAAPKVVCGFSVAVVVDDRVLEVVETLKIWRGQCWGFWYRGLSRADVMRKRVERIARVVFFILEYCVFQ